MKVRASPSLLRYCRVLVLCQPVALFAQHAPPDPALHGVAAVIVTISVAKPLSEKGARALVDSVLLHEGVRVAPPGVTSDSAVAKLIVSVSSTFAEDSSSTGGFVIAEVVRSARLTLGSTDTIPVVTFRSGTPWSARPAALSGAVHDALVKSLRDVAAAIRAANPDSVSK
jgi:hypothetical protein